MPGPSLEVADIFRARGPAYRAQNSLPVYQRRLMTAIEACRTAELGGHLEICGHCDNERIVYNSCCNRHCPKCLNLARGKWIERRQGELLPIDYYHVVFTIPKELNDLGLRNKEQFFKIMFDASAATLLTIAKDPKHLGALIGFFSILHTWGQDLMFHPHIHCVVTGGGLNEDSKWISTKPGFFLSVRVLSRRFRGLFLDALKKAFQDKLFKFPGLIAGIEAPAAFQALLAPLANIEWVVYAKPPFGGPSQVLEYLGRYTHRVAISNQRLLEYKDGMVSFQYKKYDSDDSQKSRSMTITDDEFIRRFLLHSLPPGFQRIRHYGLLASRNKKKNLALCRELLNADTGGLLPTVVQVQTVVAELMVVIRSCPLCKVGAMVRAGIVAPVCRLDSS